MSYATIVNRSGGNWKNENYLSLAGVYKKSKDEQKVKAPLALEEYLKNHPYIKTIITHLDNDEVGIRAIQLISQIYGNRYTIVDKTPTKEKDVNSYLQAVLRMPTKKRKTYSHVK